VREDMRRRGIAKRLIEEVRKANPQATINLGIAVSEAGEALRKSAETSLSNTNQANETLAPAREQALPSVEAPPPAPETPTAAPVEALTTGERAAPPPPIEAAIKAASDVPEGELTSIRHEATETDRALMGVDPYEGRPAKADVDIHARALEKLQADPHAGSKLVDELISSGRLPTDEDGMLLGMELNRLKTEYNLSKSDAAAAAYKRAADLTDSLGSEAGAAFRARRFQIAKDNSFAGLSRSLEKSKGESLTPEDKAFAEDISKRLDAAEKAQAELEQKYAALEAEKAVARVKAETTKPERVTKRAARVKVLDVEIDDLVRKMASKAARANIDPEMAVDAVKLASKLIEKGVIKLADFTDFAIKSVGEHVRPYLAKAWEDAQRMRREELAKSIGEEGYTKRDLEEISKSLIESGITERETLIDELHKIVGGDRNKVRDTLSGYGKYREASKEEVDVKLRQLKQEMHKVAQIEALEKKAAPLKTGFDRGEPSDEYRRLTKKANELRKELGITTVDPERQLKTVLDANKRRLENRSATWSTRLRPRRGSCARRSKRRRRRRSRNSSGSGTSSNRSTTRSSTRRRSPSPTRHASSGSRVR